MTKRVLVVVTSEIPADEASRAVQHEVGADAELHVVATPSGLSRLDWLTNSEDDERRDAQDRAADVSVALPQGEVDADVGDVDPVQAIADALVLFPADEVMVVTRPDDDASWLETKTPSEARKRFDVPIRHLVVR